MVFIKRFLKLLILILAANILQSANAQDETSHWYFGSNAGISFIEGEPVVHTNGAINVWEGCASISSSSGDLLFYTDGIYVYDSTHKKMPNGSGLLGNPSSSQSALVVPKPADNHKYYIFTIDDIDYGGGFHGLNYSLVDMTLNDSLGDVVANEKNVNLTQPMCEKITAVGHINGIETWVITQKWGTNNFYVYLVTNEGVDPDPVISTAGIPIGISGHGIDVAKGYMRVSHDGNKIAKANAGLRMVEIFDFDNSTGIVNNGFFDDDLGCEPYGIAFSTNNRFLYVNSWKSNPGMILYQYDLEAGSHADIIDSRIIIASGLNGALQLGPDNRIYASTAEGQFLSRINQPNKLGENCDFEQDALYLDGRHCMWGLPNFISKPSDTTVGIEQFKSRESVVLYIYPNPVDDHLTIQIVGSQIGIKSIAIYNSNGLKIEDLVLSEDQEIIFNTSKWTHGMFVAVVHGKDGEVGKRKFIVR